MDKYKLIEANDTEKVANRMKNDKKTQVFEVIWLYLP